MNEQATLNPGAIEHVGEHDGWQVWRSPDGIYEAYRATGHEEKARPVVNGRAQVWNGKNTSRRVLPPICQTWEQVCRCLDDMKYRDRYRRRPVKDDNEGQAKLFDAQD